jgi:hypothetical protein
MKCAQCGRELKKREGSCFPDPCRWCDDRFAPERDDEEDDYEAAQRRAEFADDEEDDE